MNTCSFDIIVVGGGAAGMCAAISAASSFVGSAADSAAGSAAGSVAGSVAGSAAGSAAHDASSRQLNICLVEANSRVGKSILATGNGRCNISNTTLDTNGGKNQYNHPEFVQATLERYGYSEICDFFARLGLLIQADARGWAYPSTMWANSVLAVLLQKLENLGVTQYLDYRASLSYSAEQDFILDCEGKQQLRARSVIVAGGKQLPNIAIEGINYITQRPVLGPLTVDANSIKGLDGVRAKCRVTLLAEQNKSAANKTTGLATSNVQNSAVVSMQASSPIASEMGELLFRKQAVSGIAIFNLSRKAKPGDILSIDLFPDYSVKDLCHFLTELYESYQTNVSAAALLQGIMHPRLAALIIRMAITDNVAALDKSQIGLLVAQAKDFRLTVKALPAANQAQLASGGIALTDLSSTNLEFLTIPGLFAAGECIDIDAPCGGYNLHWAWASGLLAGKSAACFVNNIS